MLKIWIALDNNSIMSCEAQYITMADDGISLYDKNFLYVKRENILSVDINTEILFEIKKLIDKNMEVLYIINDSNLIQYIDLRDMSYEMVPLKFPPIKESGIYHYPIHNQ